MKVLVVHSDLNAGGGAEAYAKASIAALKRMSHSVGLLDLAGHTAPDGALIDKRFSILGLFPGLRRYSLISYALVCRSLRQVVKEYDVVIFSYGEGPICAQKSVVFAHAPRLFATERNDIAHLQANLSGIKLLVRRVYAKICKRIAHIPDNVDNKTYVISNSNWTAVQFQRSHRRPVDRTVYPQVCCPEIEPGATSDPYALIVLGRLVPNKRLEEALYVLRWLRGAGFPATLRIVGRGDSSYGKNFEIRHRNEPGLSIFTDVTDQEKGRLLGSSRFGLHLYRSEHFGISVGEMIAAGVLPFVYDGGGVAELVTNSDLRFSDIADLTAKVEFQMRQSTKQTQKLIDQLRSGEALNKALDFEKFMHSALKEAFAKGLAS